jgi:hypothetical protein
MATAAPRLTRLRQPHFGTRRETAQKRLLTASNSGPGNFRLQHAPGGKPAPRVKEDLPRL